MNTSFLHIGSYLIMFWGILMHYTAAARQPPGRCQTLDRPSLILAHEYLTSCLASIHSAQYFYFPITVTLNAYNLKMPFESHFDFYLVIKF